MFRSAVDRAGLTFIVDCPPLDEPVYVDRDMWEKVILNLLSNALKFTFEGSIAVRVRHDDGGPTVTVEDTGIGVSAAEMPRLFERFHRIETARSRSTEGSGIGLALVRELVALHGGTITADSQEGAGSTFTIRVPFGSGHLAAEDLSAPRGSAAAAGVIAEPYVLEAMRWLPGDPRAPAALEPTPTITPADDGDGQIRVLIADDNADMREYLTGLLRTSGYQVSAVVDGREALDAVRSQPPDLVISDVMMPRLDGLAAGRGAAHRPANGRGPSAAAVCARRPGGLDRGACRPGPTTTWSSRSPPPNSLPACGPTSNWLGLRNHHARWRTALVDSLAGGVLRLRRCRLGHRDQQCVHPGTRLRHGRVCPTNRRSTRGGRTVERRPRRATQIFVDGLRRGCST